MCSKNQKRLLLCLCGVCTCTYYVYIMQFHETWNQLHQNIIESPPNRIVLLQCTCMTGCVYSILQIGHRPRNFCMLVSGELVLIHLSVAISFRKKKKKTKLRSNRSHFAHHSHSSVSSSSSFFIPQFHICNRFNSFCMQKYSYFWICRSRCKGIYTYKQ